MRAKVCLFAAITTITSFSTKASEEYWSTAERLNRRTCPSPECGVVGQLMFQENVVVYEKRNGWARISKYYSANCSNGTSAYVDSGNSSCVEDNGIKDGQFSEWVSFNHLSKTRPEDPASAATAEEKLVAGSDDFAEYKEAFAKAASEAISKGACKEQDFIDMGGWLKSTNERDKPIYFTYCGNKQLYLDASTGRLY